jgi:DNA ligase-1
MLHDNIIDISNKRFKGQKIAEVIDDIASDAGRLHKEAVLEKMLVTANLGSAPAECFFYNIYLACNPFFVPGFKKPPVTEGITDTQNDWPAFWDLCEKLQARELTGHAARDAVEVCSRLFDSTEWNTVCRQVILKDLRAGISEKTVNKIVGKTKFKIPTFTVQLAQDSKGQPNKMTGKKRLEGKLDGVRVMAVITDGKVKLFSRNGKNFENFPQIEEAINNLKFKSSKTFNINSKNIVLDGEVMGESFQALMKQAQRKSDAKTEDMVFNIFDVLPLADFERGFWNAQQHKRTAWLEEQREIIEASPSLRITQGIDVDLDTSEGHDVLKRYANDCVNAGLEGIMIKDMNAPYDCKRSSAWMKWKPIITVDLTVVGINEGTGKYADNFGAFVCEGEDDGRLIRVNVGSGITDEQRTEYWKNKESINGQIVEIMADAVTQNQDGSYSLRFPRFVRFRSFDDGVKI